MAKKYYCDLCGKEIPSRQTIRLQISLISYKEGKTRWKSILSRTIRNVDYCYSCAVKTAEEIMKKAMEGVNEK